MAFRIPIGDIRALAERIGLGSVDVVDDMVTFTIHVTRADGQRIDIGAEVFSRAAKHSMEPDPRLWEPVVRQRLQELLAAPPKETPCPRP